MVFDIQSHRYEWRRAHPVKAQEAGEYLEKLAGEKGVTASTVVDESRPEEAVLHPCFEWDDYKAAEKYRRHQAREVIGDLVRVEVIKEPKAEPKAVEVQAFVNVREKPREATYKPIAAVVRDVDEVEVMLENARRDFLALKRKYENLRSYAEMQGLFEQLDEMSEG